MPLLSWSEIKEISNRIGCDVFVKRKRLMDEAMYLKSDEIEQPYEEDMGFEIIDIEKLRNEKDDK